MQERARVSARFARIVLTHCFTRIMVGLTGAPPAARAAEADAKRLLKAMSDYMAQQSNISFRYDADLEIVTKDKQKLALASSGQVTRNQSDKIRVTASGRVFGCRIPVDGKTLTLFGRTANLYGQIDVPGTIDHLIEVLRETYRKPLAWRGFAVVECIRQAHGGCDQREGSGQRRNRRCSNAITSPSGRRKWTGRFGLRRANAPSLPLRHHQQEDGAGPAIHHHDP